MSHGYFDNIKFPHNTLTGVEAIVIGVVSLICLMMNFGFITNLVMLVIFILNIGAYLLDPKIIEAIVNHIEKVEF